MSNTSRWAVLAAFVIVGGIPLVFIMGGDGREARRNEYCKAKCEMIDARMLKTHDRSCSCKDTNGCVMLWADMYSGTPVTTVGKCSQPKKTETFE